MLGYQKLPTLPEIVPTPDAISTPFGIRQYGEINRWALISIPFIDEIGTVGRIQMRSSYLDITIDKMAKVIRLDSSDLIKSLLDFSRIIVAGAVVADRPTLLYKTALNNNYLVDTILSRYLPEPTDVEYYPFYTYTETNRDSIGIIKELQSNIIYCLDRNQNTLPSTVIDSWLQTTINPIMADFKSKMK
jgi:hypothetical protein